MDTSTFSLLPPLDPEILKRHLPDDIHATVDQVTANVSQSVDSYIAQFKAAVQKQADDLVAGTSTTQLQSQLKSVTDDFAQQMDLTGDLATLKKALSAASAAATAANGATPQLVKAIGDLQTSAGALDTKINDMRGKVRDFADKSTRLAVATALKAFTGVI